MERNRSRLWIALAVAGWLTTGVLAVTNGTPQRQSVPVDEDAVYWKRQAGKAYTELLKARAGPDAQRVLIPAGARFGCTMQENTTVEGRTMASCQDGIIYPP